MLYLRMDDMVDRRKHLLLLKTGHESVETARNGPILVSIMIIYLLYMLHSSK